DPAHADSQTADRRRGGATPRRRVHRYPRRLNRTHLAELLGEILISGLNHPDQSDIRRLQLILTVSRLILRSIDHPSYPPLPPPTHAPRPQLTHTPTTPQ